MKLIIILLTMVFSINALAGMWAVESDVISGDKFKKYTLKRHCPGKCIPIPKNHRYEFFEPVDELADTPVYSKSEVVSCGDECSDIFSAGVTCLDSSEKAILNLDTKEIYCSKIIRLEEKPTGRKKLVENASAKATHEAKILKTKERDERKRRGTVARQKCKDALDYIAGGNLDSDLTEEQVDAMQAAFSDIFQALQANRPGKALRLIKLVTDPAYEDLKNNIIEILE